ncbi:MAG TPA: cytochrome c oxidase subunit 3 [Actinomycetota bacterium]|jgi:heme/copper-type cytochrome/quinol oxidase subunit 3|nr:cytochrome c oxidase subunit 3 [Actinomycetota bacterium]
MSVTHVEARGARSPGWWGMVLFILAELTLFGTALASYLFLRFEAPTWPPPGVEPPDIVLGAIATGLLLGSSIPMLLAERGIERGSVVRMRVCIAISIVLALGFLAIQGYEYSQASFSWRTDAYGSLFFTILSLHALHVIGAILIVGWLEVRSFAGHFNREHHVAVQTGSLYWHFVDLVWLGIFLVLYISPRF